MRVAAGWWVAVAAVSVLSGCGQPDRQEEADALERAVAAMSGVEDVDVLYSNNFTMGSKLDIDVIATEADISQVADIAARIEEIKDGHFDGYDQSATFVVADGVVLERHGTLEPDPIEDDTRAARNIADDIPGSEVFWTQHERDGHSTVRFESAPAAAALDAVRSYIPADDVLVTVRKFEGEPQWRVSMPFGEDEARTIRDSLAGSPLNTLAVSVTRGHVSGLTVAVEDEAHASVHLEAVLALFEPTEDHPLMLEWKGTGGGADRKFSGSVHVAGCTYAPNLAESEPERFYTEEALALRDRLRAQYDTCE